MRRLMLGLMIAAALSGSPARASDEVATALRDFDFIDKTLRDDSAGFPDKTAGPKLAEYEALARAQRAAIAADPTQFMDATWKLLAWFKDGHLGLEELPTRAPPRSPAPTSPSDAELAKQGRFLAVDDKSLRRQRNLLAPRGIYETIDGTYTVAVVPDPAKRGSFVGVILDSKNASWVRGQVKFIVDPDGPGKWRGTLWRRDHSPVESPVTYRFGGSYAFFEAAGSVWRRAWPASTIDQDRVFQSGNFFLKPLSKSTLWLRLPNFDISNRATIEGLLRDNRALLEETPNLLIDLRSNGGGSDASYLELMKWIYSRPIVTIGTEFRASSTNAELYGETLKRPDFPNEYRPMLERLIVEMKTKPAGTWVQTDPRPFSITVLPDVKPFPKRVAIIGTGAGSSGDQFVLDARQSRKVTTFGGPTAGVLDYSNQLQRMTPSGRYIIKWPTSRSMRLPEHPIDNVGIPADIPIPDGADPIGFVQAWLERQVD